MKERNRPVRHYRIVWERLTARNMTVYDLAEAIENKTGKFVNDRWLKKRLKDGQRIGSRMYGEIKEILGITDASTE